MYLNCHRVAGPASRCNNQVMLGIANFYTRFIRNFLIIVKTMTNMLKGRKASNVRTVRIGYRNMLTRVPAEY